MERILSESAAGEMFHCILDLYAALKQLRSDAWLSYF